MSQKFSVLFILNLNLLFMNPDFTICPKYYIIEALTKSGEKPLDSSMGMKAASAEFAQAMEGGQPT